jgi:manganese oxidase
MDWRIDELMPPVQALGYNAQWPGPTIRVNQGDTGPGHLQEQPQGDDRDPLPRRRVRGLLQDGVPFITQKPLPPGETFAYEFAASRPAR